MLPEYLGLGGPAEDKNNFMASLLSGRSPVELACLLGLFAAIGPDHLCILINLTMGMGLSWKAVKVVLMWSFGHNFGIVFVSLLSILLPRLSHYKGLSGIGDYVAGGLLILVGIYFLVREARYLELQDDGSYKCSPCCGDTDSPTVETGCQVEHDHQGCSESHPLLPTQETGTSTASPRNDLKGFFIGCLQGIICPSCVLSVGFAGKVGSTHPGAASIVSFMVALVIATSVFTVLTVLFIQAIARQFGANLKYSSAALYRSSCCFTILVGLFWITAARFGWLEYIEPHVHGGEHEGHEGHERAHH